MRRSLTLWGVALIFLSLLGIAARVSPLPEPQDEAKKVLPEIESAKKSSRKISKAAQDKIEKALGEKLAPGDLTPTLFEGKCTVPLINSMEKTRVMVCILTVKGPKGEIKLGVAAAPEDKFLLAVKILKNDDDKYLETAPFLAQFNKMDFQYTDHLSNSADALAVARKKAKDGDKDLSAVLDLMSTMRAMSLHWDAMSERLDKSDATASAEAEAQKKAFQEVEKMIPRIGFMKTNQSERFKKNISGTLKDLDNISGLIKGQKYVDAKKATYDLEKSSCSKCHADTQRSFREKRHDLGVGNGYFSVGLDVSSPDDKKDSVQALANGIRKALLLISEAK